MAMVCNYFRQHRKDLPAPLPEGFLDSLMNSYNYTVPQEVQECLYDYNEERIAKDIQNYLFAVNFETGHTEKCIYTGELIDISDDYFEAIERRILGRKAGAAERRTFRKEIQSQYTAKTLTQDILLEGKPITTTDIYQSLRERYVHNLKEKVFDPFMKNENFRRAIKDYGTEAFNAYDKRICKEVGFLIGNLMGKYSYSEQGARDVCIYVIDNDLARTFMSG